MHLAGKHTREIPRLAHPVVMHEVDLQLLVLGEGDDVAAAHGLVHEVRALGEQRLGLLPHQA